jgi:uncharacterized membrane protein
LGLDKPYLALIPIIGRYERNKVLLDSYTAEKLKKWDIVVLILGMLTCLPVLIAFCTEYSMQLLNNALHMQCNQPQTAYTYANIIELYMFAAYVVTLPVYLFVRRQHKFDFCGPKQQFTWRKAIQEVLFRLFPNIYLGYVFFICKTDKLAPPYKNERNLTITIW